MADKAPKSALFARFKMDEDKEEDGVWADFGDGIRVRIRRFKSRKVQDARKEVEKPYADVIRKGPLPVEVAEELLVKQMAKGVVSDWEGITDENGKVLSCTPANVEMILKALPEFRDEIFQTAIDRDAFKAALDEDAEGNSPAS